MLKNLGEVSAYLGVLALQPAVINGKEALKYISTCEEVPVDSSCEDFNNAVDDCPL